MVFLIETLSFSSRINDLSLKLGYNSSFSVDRNGHSDGLAVFWKAFFNCEILNYSSQFINIMVHDDEKGDWRLTSFWGYSDSSRRRESWDLLRSLSSLSTVPWCVIGDFNDLLTSEDKCGGSNRPAWLYRGFRQAISDCSLLDLPLEGYQFTWSNKSLGTSDSKEERLDRAFVTSTW